MAVNKTDFGPRIPPTLIKPQSPKVDLTLGLPEEEADTAWLPGRAATLALPGRSKAPAPAGIAIDPEFPQLQAGSPPALALRETVSSMLSPIAANAPGLQAAIDRLAPALSQTTRAEAEKALVAEIKRLVPDPQALAAALRREGFTGIGSLSKGAPTAEAFASSIAQRLSRSINVAQIEVAKQVTREVAASLGQTAPAELKTAFQWAMHVDRLGVSSRGFASKAQLVKDLTIEMRHSLRNSGVSTEALAGKIDKLAARAADALLDANVKALTAKGFTEASAKSFTMAPTANAEGSAKVVSWGEKVMAHVPQKVIDLATAAAETVEKAAAASPMLSKAAPYLARVVPYLNTPVAGLTLAHSVEVHNDPEAWKIEEGLAYAAAALNVAAAGAAYVPVPVLDWAASFAGGALSLGFSGLEWGTSALRKSLK